MDFLRRTAQGRKAELVGFSGFKQDFFMRLLGLPERAEGIWSGLSATARAELESYSRGVNRGFQELEASGSYEMAYFGQRRLARWSPVDSLTFLLLQSFDQTRKGFEVEVEENTRLKVLGQAALPDFLEDGLPWETTVLKNGEYLPRLGGRTAGVGVSTGASVKIASLEPLLEQLPEVGGIGGGSNNWIVSPSRTTTGKAILSNDPHLALRHPPFWYWAHIEGGEIDAIGATLPGVPIIASGSSRKVAWGLTNSYLDCADLAYVPSAEIEAAGTISQRPLIWIKWGPLRLPFFFKSWQRTAKGWPILPLDAPPGHRLVLRWTGLDLAAADIEGFLGLFRMKTVEEADRAFASVGLPSWNFVFADTRGGIGYRAIGHVIRRSQPPVFGIQTSSLQAFENFQTLAPTEMPHLLNPERGYVVTANNRHWPDDGVHHGGRAYSRGFRAFRIEEMLTAKPKHDRESMLKMQCDSQAVDARFLLPELLSLVTKSSQADPRLQSLVTLLRSWDYQADTSCRACSVYRRWVDGLMADLGLNELSLYRRLKRNRAGLEQSATQALLAVVGQYGDRIPSWGEIHRNSFHHLAGAEFFAVPSMPTRGDTHSVDPGTQEWKGDHYDHNNGASHRLVVELTEPPQVWAILAGENADQPRQGLMDVGSAWSRWASCEQDQREFPFDWSRVKPRRIEL